MSQPQLRQRRRTHEAEHALGEAEAARDAAMRGARFASEELYGAEERCRVMLQSAIECDFDSIYQHRTYLI